MSNPYWNLGTTPILQRRDAMVTSDAIRFWCFFSWRFFNEMLCVTLTTHMVTSAVKTHRPSIFILTDNLALRTEPGWKRGYPFSPLIASRHGFKYPRGLGEWAEAKFPTKRFSYR